MIKVIKAWCNQAMNKQQAIDMLGGKPSKAAKAIGITPQAVNGWPEELSDRIRDRVELAFIKLGKTKDGVTKSSTPKAKNKVIVCPALETNT